MDFRLQWPGQDAVERPGPSNRMGGCLVEVVLAPMPVRTNATIFWYLLNSA